jgi:hypothetical protein
MEAIDALREDMARRVYFIAPGILLCKERPVITGPSIKAMFDLCRELTVELDRYHVIVDLTETAEPSAEVRALLRKEIGKLTALRHMALFTGRNAMINVVAKFILGRMPVSLRVVRTFEEALAHIERMIEREATS